MDISKTTEPKSDQQNFDDYATGPKTVTVKAVKAGSAEQPVEVHLVEYPGRPFKPSKSMRRVLVAAWGAEASEWTDRQITLYGDPTVRFGGVEVGGIRISHLSHIDKPLTVGLTVTRGKRKPFVVQPLQDDGTVDGLMDALNAASTLLELQEAWVAVQAAGWSGHQGLVAVKDARKTDLTKAEPVSGDGSEPDPTDPDFMKFQAQQDDTK